jgi:cytochrome c biogenesis protein CcmG/thiol:disulfide interchange protein DsbE
MVWRNILPGCLLAFAPSLLLAADVKLATLQVGEEIYTNVTVTSSSATDIYFSHSRGIGNAKLKNLDPEVQKKFRFDPAKAAAKEQEQAEAFGRYTTALKEARPAKAAPEVNESPEQAAAEPDAANGVARSYLNQPAPSIMGEKWLTEQPELKGKFVLVDFWATWCAPCRQSIPALNALHNKFKDRMVVIGLSDETEEKVRKMSEPKIDYFVAIDTQHRSASEIGLKRIPYTLMVDPKGIVCFEGHPSLLDEKLIENLFAQYHQ